MEFLQKINQIILSRIIRGTGLFLLGGIILGVFSAVSFGSAGALYQPFSQQIQGYKAVVAGADHCVLAVLQGNSSQLVQNIRRGQRSSSSQYSPAWRLRILFHFSPFAVLKLLHSQEWFLSPQVNFFSFQRYLQSSLPVRAGPFHS